MKEPHNQPGAGDGEAASSAGLTSRLMQRHNQPIGLVDTNHAERFYERTAGWVAQRFEMLDHWKTRYDTGQTAETGNGKFVFAGTPVQSSPVVSSEALVALSARQTVPSAPSAPAPSRREHYRVRRHVASPTSPSTSPPTSTPLVTDSTSTGNAPELPAENVDVAGDGPVGVTGVDPELTTHAAPDRGDPRSAEITTISREHLQPMTRLIATEKISRSVDSAKTPAPLEVAAGKTSVGRVDRSSLLVQSNTHEATGHMTSSSPFAQSPVPSSGASSSSSVSQGPAQSLTLVSAPADEISGEIPSSEAAPTRVAEIESPPDKAESSAAPPLRKLDSSPAQVQRQPSPGGGGLDRPTDSLPLRTQPKPSPGGEELRQQIESSPQLIQRQPTPGGELLVQQTSSLPLRIQRQPLPGSEELPQPRASLPHVERQPSPGSEESRQPTEQLTDSSPQPVQRQASPGSQELPQPTASSPELVLRPPAPGRERLGQQTDPLRVPSQSSSSERLAPLTGSLPLRIQRQPAPGGEESLQHSDSPVFSNQQTPVAEQASNPDAAAAPDHFAAQQRLSTSEIQVAPVSQPGPTTVLRKAAEGSPGSPSRDGLLMRSTANTNVALPLKVNRSALPAEVIVARQGEDVTSAGQSPAASGTSPESPAAVAQPGAIDLDQLAEQVGRVLSRQLAVERERRGNKGWH